MMSARGPRSKMSPTMCIWSTAMRLMTEHTAWIRLGAWSISMMVEIMFSK